MAERLFLDRMNICKENAYNETENIIQRWNKYTNNYSLINKGNAIIKYLVISALDKINRTKGIDGIIGYALRQDVFSIDKVSEIRN